MVGAVAGELEVASDGIFICMADEFILRIQKIICGNCLQRTHRYAILSIVKGRGMVAFPNNNARTSGKQKEEEMKAQKKQKGTKPVLKKVEKPVKSENPLEILRSVDVKPVSKEELPCAVSKRGIAAILAMAVILGYKATKQTFAKYAELTAAYRHGMNTTKATGDGNSNNMVYIRHATLGINGNASHSWAKSVLEKLSEKDIASAVNALAMDKKSLASLAKKSKNPLASKLAKVA